MAGPENRPEWNERTDKNAEALKALKDALGQDSKAFEWQVWSTPAADRAEKYVQSQEPSSRFGYIDPAQRWNWDLKTGGTQWMDRVPQRPSAQPISPQTIKEFRAINWLGATEPLWQNATRDLQAFNLAKLKNQPTPWMDRNWNGSIVGIENWFTVTRRWTGNTARWPWASNN